ncbi:MAG: alkene reductase [Pseudomonadota bacterium]
MQNELFQSHQLGDLHLPIRIVMAPMTRCRTTQPGDVPNKLMAEYYAQRASAGLIISEATQISPQGKGYSFTPGIHSDVQIAGWRIVTNAVHEAGGRMFLQLWHVGRMSHASFHGGERPVAPSAIAPKASVWIADTETGAGGMVACPTPRALELAEIADIIDDYRRAAASAMSAGFDGVEIHGANGYLIDQFLRGTSNARTDKYGGDPENRIRFLQEVAQAVAAEVGAERTGIRLAPFITERGMDDDMAVDTILMAAAELDRLGIAYIHVVEADWDDEPSVPGEFRIALRQTYSGTIIVAGRFDRARGDAIIEFGLADLVAFGRPFVANPDLPARLALGLPLVDYDASKLYGGGPTGYVDYGPSVGGRLEVRRTP